MSVFLRLNKRISSQVPSITDVITVSGYAQPVAVGTQIIDPRSYNSPYGEVKATVGNNGTVVGMHQWIPELSNTTILQSGYTSVLNGFPLLVTDNAEKFGEWEAENASEAAEVAEAFTRIEAGTIKGKWRFGEQLVWGKYYGTLVDTTIVVDATVNGKQVSALTIGAQASWLHSASSAQTGFVSMGCYSGAVSSATPSTAPSDYDTITTGAADSAKVKITHRVIDFGETEQIVPLAFVEWLKINAVEVAANVYRVAGASGAPIYAETARVDKAVGISVYQSNELKAASFELIDGTAAELRWVSYDAPTIGETFLGLAKTPMAKVPDYPINSTIAVDFSTNVTLYEVYGIPTKIEEKPQGVSTLYYFDADGRMQLTEEGLRQNGIDLRARMDSDNESDATTMINGFLRRVSSILYAYISRFSLNEAMQKHWIQSLPSARDIFFRALVAQATYMAYGGDRTLGGTREDRAMAIDMVAIDELNRTIAELGVPLVYMGIY